MPACVDRQTEKQTNGQGPQSDLIGCLHNVQKLQEKQEVSNNSLKTKTLYGASWFYDIFC